MTADLQSGASRPTLEDVAHSQTDELFYALALISAVADRVEATATLANPDATHTLRLAMLAREKVQGAIDALDPYI
jgi:hypothetical protein